MGGRYYTSFPWLARWACAVFGVGGFMIGMATRGDAVIALAASAASAGVVGLIFALCTFTFPVTIDPAGIRCYDALGSYSHIRWEEMASVRPWGALGFRYVAVRATDGRRSQTIPLYLHRMEDFVNRVRQLAPVDNPLRRFLDENVSRLLGP